MKGQFFKGGFLAGSVVLLTSLIGGCATLHDEHVAAQKETANLHADQQAHTATPVKLVTYNSYPYLMGTPIRPAAKVPKLLRQHVVYNSSEQQPLRAIAERISKMTGIAVIVDHLVNPAKKSSQSSSMGGSGMMGGGMGLPSTMGVGGAYSLQAEQMFITDPRYLQAEIHWKGSISGLLDTVASRFGVSWKFRNGEVEIYKYMTRTFPVSLSVMNNKISSSITSATSSTTGSSSGGTAGNSAITADSSSNLKPFTDVLQGVDAIIGKQGVATANPSLGVVTVTTTPQRLGEVSEYIRQQNKQATRNVLIKVRIYQVDTSNDIDMTASMQAAFNKIAGGAGAAILGNASGDSSSLMSAIVGNGTTVPTGLQNGGLNFTGSNNGSLQTGSAILRALDSIGTTRLVKSGSVMTANGVPGPLQVGQTLNYVSSSDTSVSNGTSTTSLQSSSLNLGFTGNFLPRVLTGGRILLNYQMQLSSLVQMQSVQSSGTTIQLPQVDTQSASQSVVLKSGQTLVLAGFGSSDSGRGAGFGLLSGYSQHNNTDSWLVILIHIQEVNS